ncbi:unnamed protein product [Urochloa humidicola]
MEGSNDWASLPWLILQPIAAILTDPKDFAHIRSVCPKWRDAIPPKRLTAHQPWIMITEGLCDEHYGRVMFHSLSSSDGSHVMTLTVLRGKRVAGSGAGLLIGIDQRDDLSGVLVNPMNGESSKLPRLPDCFRGEVTSGFATDQEVNGKAEVIVVVWAWTLDKGPTVALWRRGSDDGWATTHDADLERFWTLLPQHWNRLVTYGVQVLEGELALAAAAAEDNELVNSSRTFLPRSKAEYLIEHEGRVRFLFEFYGYNPEIPEGPRVIFGLNDMEAPELRDKAIFQSGADGACYVIPATDDNGLSKNALYYFDWRHLEDAAEDGGGGRTEAFCLCKVDMLEGVDTIVKQVSNNPKHRGWDTTRWFVPSFKF